MLKKIFNIVDNKVKARKEREAFKEKLKNPRTRKSKTIRKRSAIKYNKIGLLE